ncbi:MAG: DUF7601 domain-containing protein [Bacillota bacterium]
MKGTLFRRSLIACFSLMLVFVTAAPSALGCVLCLESPRDDSSYTAITSIPIRNSLELDDDVLPPDTDFVYHIEPAAATANVLGNPVSAGVAAAVSVSGATNFGPSSERNDAVISVDAAAFPAPGIYRYEVTEENGGYEGIRYDDNIYFLDLYVRHIDQNDSSKGLLVYTTAVSKIDLIHGTEKETTIAGGTAGAETNAIPFSNSMLDDPDKVKDDEFSVHPLKIEREIHNKFGLKKRTARFSVTIYGSETETAESYHLIVTRAGDGDGIAEATSVITSGQAAEFELAPGETARVTGLSKSDSYVLTEEGQAGYAAVLSENGKTVAESGVGDDVTIEGTMGAAEKTYLFAETQEHATAREILSSYGPPLLIAAVIAAVVVPFLRWRKKLRAG